MLKMVSSKILLFLFLAWIGIAFVRTGYNASKLFTEERAWYGLSDEQKRAKQFGDYHYFFRFVQTHTKSGSNIMFFTDDNEAYYLARYYLYPTKRMGIGESFLWSDTSIRYDYYMIYPANHKNIYSQLANKPQFKTFKKIALYHGLNGNIGVLYQK